MDPLPQPDDLDFSRESLAKLDLTTHKETNPLRWERITHGIVEFSDIVEELTGKRGSMISCPFHGRDSTASFAIYPVSQGNCGYCFGCPPGQGTFDAFRFVKEMLGLSSRYKALQWIEKNFNLEKLEDIDKDEEEEITLSFEDLSEHYIRHVIKEPEKDVDTVLEYIKTYFKAEKDKQPLLLARILGKDSLARVFQEKENR